MRKSYNIHITIVLTAALAVYLAVAGQELLRIPGAVGSLGLPFVLQFYGRSFLAASSILGVLLTTGIVAARIFLAVRGDAPQKQAADAYASCGEKLRLLLTRQSAFLSDYMRGTKDKELKNNYFLGGALSVLFFLAYLTQKLTREEALVPIDCVKTLFACLLWGELLTLALWLLSRRNRNQLRTADWFTLCSKSPPIFKNLPGRRFGGRRGGSAGRRGGMDVPG